VLGTPYYISKVDNKIIIPEINEYTRIVSYNEHDILENKPWQQSVIHDFGEAIVASDLRKDSIVV
jgi:hypothetical protein